MGEMVVSLPQFSYNVSFDNLLTDIPVEPLVLMAITCKVKLFKD